MKREERSGCGGNHTEKISSFLPGLWKDLIDRRLIGAKDPERMHDLAERGEWAAAECRIVREGFSKRVRKYVVWWGPNHVITTRMAFVFHVTILSPIECCHVLHSQSLSHAMQALCVS